MVPYPKLLLKLEEAGIGTSWVGDKAEEEVTTGGLKIGLQRITGVVLQDSTSKSLLSH